jgi:hypothetical protein
MNYKKKSDLIEIKRLLDQYYEETTKSDIRLEISRTYKTLTEKNVGSEVAKLLQRIYRIQLVEKFSFTPKEKELIGELQRKANFRKATWNPFFYVTEALSKLFG